MVAAIPDRTAIEVFGGIDAMKVRSSMTLFHRVAPDEPAFQAVLDRFYDGIGGRSHGFAPRDRDGLDTRRLSTSPGHARR